MVGFATPLTTHSATRPDNRLGSQELQRAYNGFLAQRKIDQGHDDTVSIVLFASSARIVCEAFHIDSAPGTLPYRGGGTSFAGAMVQAHDILRRADASKHSKLVFMSDGGAHDASAAASTATRIINERPNTSVEVIAFGTGADMRALGQIANAGQTTVQTAGTGGLTKIFVDIARGASAASQELYNEICTRIAEEVSRQLMLEYL